MSEERMEPLLFWDRKIKAYIPITRVTCPECNEPRMWSTWKRCGECERQRNLKRYRVIRRVSAKVYAAIKAGKLPRASKFACKDCGIPATEYDHRDYSRPLDVEPVCHPCNLRRGPGLNAYETAT